MGKVIKAESNEHLAKMSPEELKEVDRRIENIKRVKEKKAELERWKEMVNQQRRSIASINEEKKKYFALSDEEAKLDRIVEEKVKEADGMLQRMNEMRRELKEEENKLRTIRARNKDYFNLIGKEIEENAVLSMLIFTLKLGQKQN